jgi:hypothetical protein
MSTPIAIANQVITRRAVDVSVARDAVGDPSGGTPHCPDGCGWSTPTTAGDVLLPIGYAATSPIPIGDYLATHAQ